MHPDYAHRQYILFDLDGTISDPKVGITKSLQYALKYYGIVRDDLDSLSVYIGPPLQSSVRELLGFEGEQAKEAIAKYREYYQPYGIYENTLYPGVAAFLQLCCQEGKKLILATSKAEPYARQIMEYWGLDGYFTFIAGSEMHGGRTEKHEVIAYALESCGITADQAVMIGDRQHDILGARKNGIPCISILYGYGDREEFIAAEADLIVDTVADLQQILLGNAVFRNREQPLGLVVNRMIAHEQNDTQRIVHALKMHGYALGIAAGEGITGRQLQLLQAAAILHDVGINEAKRRFATVTPKLQEEQGAILAGRFLRQLNWDEDLIAEICFLVGNHHSYEVDGGPLLQIIFEADYLVNYQERLQREGVQQNQPSPEEIQKRFRTESGRRLFATMHP